jgi:hypothetical protein
MHRTPIHGRIGSAAARAGRRSVAVVRVTPLTHRRRARVRSDAFSTRYKISSDRSNDQPWMAGLGRLAMDGVTFARTARPDEEATDTTRKEYPTGFALTISHTLTSTTAG